MIVPNNADSVYVVITPDPNVQCPDMPTAQSSAISNYS